MQIFEKVGILVAIQYVDVKQEILSENKRAINFFDVNARSLAKI